MANWKAGMSSDAVGASGCEYDVFLNFRGLDTRYNFTDLLYDRLVDAGVQTFRDEEKLPVGDVISDRLQHAINNSKLYISIFSRNYGSSKWCLRELKLIMDNVSNSGDQKSIFPIFLLVKPDDVKLKIRPDSDAPYKAAFEEHEKKFPDEVEAWKTALGKVDERKGWVVKEDTSQAAIVKLVVKEVLEKLRIKQKSVPENFVGLDDRIKELTKLLDVNHDDVRLVGIYGMGGIGKTTIAMVIFDQLSSHFGKCCSFLEGIRERRTKEGIVSLQKQLLSDVIGAGTVGEINNKEEGMRRIKATLSSKKVLVVLDDVDKKVLINNLIGNSKLYQGSRIIITTRETSVLKVQGFRGKTQLYEMLKMDDDPALQLFNQHAFGGDFPSDDYCRLSNDIVSTTGGLPLAIKVIGSLLNGKSQESWKEKLEKLRNVPEEKILKKLRISYDDLAEYHKQIFLDIACFFVNEKKTDAIYMWTDCEFYPIEGIEVLTDRCLIKILDNGKFWMHDQLIALGRQIVRENSQNNCHKQSRLWIAKEALQIIKTDMMKDNVQALEILGDGFPIEIRNEDFKRLPNLRFLDLKKGTYAGDFAMCHPKLRWFSWSNPYFWTDNRMDRFDLDFRANNLYFDELVVCKFNSIDFKDDSKAWDLIKKARNLKVLNINFCCGITSNPDISRCSTLERLTLYDCSELKRINFIGDLRLLIELKIERCSKFTDLPEDVGNLVKLKCFSLKSCKGLIKLPGSLGNLISLTEFNLSDTKIPELPNSIVQLKSLRILRFQLYQLSYSSHDWQLPSGFGTLVNLEELNLSRCYGMKGEIPIGIGKCSSLKILNLEGTRICGIPKTINKLHQLQTLNLTCCQGIQELPKLPTSLTCLLLQSISLLSVPNLSELTNLVKLLLSDSSYYRDKSNLISGCDLRWIGNLYRLEWLELHLRNVSAPQELASLSHLEELVLTHLDLKPLVQLPSSDWSWRNLLTLKIHSCEEYIPLEGFPQLENFTVGHCAQLERLSIPSELRKLQKVIVSSSSKLVEIQVMGLSKSLEILEVSDCKSLTRISGLPYLKNLKRLKFEQCTALANVDGLNELDSLKSLVVHSCSSLKRLIDASRTKIPDYCTVVISMCGYFIKDTRGMRVKDYREKIPSIKDSFTIRFHLGVKKPIEVWFGAVRGIEREKEGVDPDSLTYEGLIADVKNFGFHFKRMWYETKETLKMQMEIKSDRYVNEMLSWASYQGFIIHLYVEGGVNSEWEGEYDEEMKELLREEGRMKTDVHSDEDGDKGDVSCPNEDSNSTLVGGESETHGTSSVDYFQLEPGNAECFEATTSIAEKDPDSVKKQGELHEEPRDLETTLKRYGEEGFPNILNKGKRQRDDDHASHANTITKSSTHGQQSGIPQHVTRRTTRQAAEKQLPVDVAALPVEAVSPSRKKKKNYSKQVNPIRRSARLMKGPAGGTSDIVHLD